MGFALSVSYLPQKQNEQYMENYDFYWAFPYMDLSPSQFYKFIIVQAIIDMKKLSFLF